MGKRFVLRAGLHVAMIPGLGRVKQGFVVEGEQYARFVPSILTEILDSAPVAAPVATILVEPAPILPPPPPPEPLVAEMPEPVAAPLLEEIPMEEKPKVSEDKPKKKQTRK